MDRPEDITKNDELFFALTSSSLLYNDFVYSSDSHTKVVQYRSCWSARGSALDNIWGHWNTSSLVHDPASPFDSTRLSNDHTQSLCCLTIIGNRSHLNLIKYFPSRLFSFVSTVKRYRVHGGEQPTRRSNISCRAPALGESFRYYSPLERGNGAHLSTNNGNKCDLLSKDDDQVWGITTGTTWKLEPPQCKALAYPTQAQACGIARPNVPTSESPRQAGIEKP